MMSKAGGCQNILTGGDAVFGHTGDGSGYEWTQDVFHKSEWHQKNWMFRQGAHIRRGMRKNISPVGQTRGSYRRLLDNAFDINDAISIIEDMTDDERSNCCSDYWDARASCQSEGGTGMCPGTGYMYGGDCCQCYLTSNTCTESQWTAGNWNGQAQCACMWTNSFSCNLGQWCCGGGGGSSPIGGTYGMQFYAPGSANFGGQGSGRRTGGPIRRRKR